MKNFEDFLKEHPEVSTNSNYDDIKEFDKAKTKVLKYVLYKKRTEQEIKQKFLNDIDENLLEDVIQNLKENNYISDSNYIERAVKEFIAIKNCSIKEIYNKLYSKGIERNIIEEYFSKHQEELEEYEINCAKKIILKKQLNLEKEKIQTFLFKKGYKNNSIKEAFEQLEN